MIIWFRQPKLQSQEKPQKLVSEKSLHLLQEVFLKYHHHHQRIKSAKETDGIQL